MEKFFEDERCAEEITKNYSGKTLAEITDLEDKRKDSMQNHIDSLHDGFIEKGRTKMLTVQKLIDYLKTQDPNACILAYENNSFAYIEQMPDLPNYDICTVAEAKKHLEENLRNWYKNDENSESKINKEISQTFRYAKDSDIVINFC